MYLARKITRSKWDAKHGLDAGEIPSDAVTIDLRTMGNTLSFWRCGNGTEQEVVEAVLALAAGAERIDKVDVVWLAEEDLRADGQSLRDSAGRTPVVSLIHNHVDVQRLDYVRLGRVAERVLAAVGSGRYQRFTRKRVAKLVADAVQQKRIALSELNEKVRDAVCTTLGLGPQ